MQPHSWFTTNRQTEKVTGRRRVPVYKSKRTIRYWVHTTRMLVSTLVTVCTSPSLEISADSHFFFSFLLKSMADCNLVSRRYVDGNVSWQRQRQSKARQGTARHGTAEALVRLKRDRMLQSFTFLQ